MSAESHHRLALQCMPDMPVMECAEDTTLLEALRSSGLPVRKACRNGVCGLCRCRVVSGEITYHWKVPHGLWQKDIDQGFILPCIAHAITDLVLDQIPLMEPPTAPTEPTAPRR